jgi:hypothetical protein
MSIELNNIASGYSTPLINDNFQKLEEELNQNVLRRDGLEPGEANEMRVPLDMNSHPILNAITDPDNPGSLVTQEFADSRYVNLSGDTMQGSLNMDSYPVFVRIAVNGNEPARKDELDQERSQRQAGDSQLHTRIDGVVTNYQAADANLQAQISDTAPLEASAFSPISWHDQVVENSVTIPENKNAWSFGPVMRVTEGQSVSVGEGSYWTIANGDADTVSSLESYDEGEL